MSLLTTELRLRFRRTSTHVVMLATMLMVWFTIVDKSSGYTLMAANSARVAYNTPGLALGSSVIATILLGLFGFYLVRGRVDDDLHTGLGQLIATTPMDNTVLLLSRWAGGVVYLASLIIALMLTMMVLQAVRGEGAVEPLVFFQFHALTIVPNIFFIVAMATLCDAHQRLMGKLGDVLYFLFWLGQVTLGAVIVSTHPDGVSLLLFDPTGMGVLTQRGQFLLHTQGLAVGLNTFDPSLAPIVLGSGFWTWPMIAARVASSGMAIIPLALAITLFHRFSPDSIAASRSRKAWEIGARINRMLRPVDVFTWLLFAIAARLPRAAAPIAVELALTFASHRLAGPLIVAAGIAGAVLDDAALPALLLAAVLCWGIIIADLSTRDFKADTELLLGSVTSCAAAYWRQGITAVLLGCMMTGPVIVRWSSIAPALVGGIIAVAAIAQLLGRATRGPRAFTVLFLFGLYVATQAF